MKHIKLLMLLAMTASSTVLAQEHPACSNPAYHLEAHTPADLRDIAASCQSKSIATLFYNRAYHADMVQEAATLAGLIAYSDDRGKEQFDAYRLYMALLENMTPIWYPDSEARVAFLNREYDRRGEIARLRLRGYDHVADHLERTTMMRQEPN